MSNALTEKFKSHLQKINLKKLEKIFFALFLLSIPIQTRSTFLTPQTYLNGAFNEYTTLFLYLSDIFLITTLFLFFVNIIKKATNLTKISNFSIKNCLIHSSPHIIPITFVLITLITWSFASIFWSEYKNIAFYQSIKVLEFALLFLYIRFRLQWFGFNKFIALIFISGLIQSLVGVTQYYLQKSLGLKILMESVLSPEIPNVAKIVVDGERIIRAYGTFPHPNVFSGFLILSIFCGVWLLLSYKTLKIYKITSRMPFNALTAKKMADLKHNKQIVSRETILYIFLIIGIIAHLTAFILTFSRTSWLISILIFFIFTFLVIKSKLFYHPALKLRTTGACPSKHAYFLKKFFNLKQISTIVSRETICNERRRVKQFITFITRKTTIILIFSLIIALLLISCSNWKQIGNRANIVENTYQQSIDYRILYNDIAINIIKKYPLTGIGGKNFTLQMQEFTATPLEWWQFQPAHNIYLLVACELGIIGLALLLLFIFLVLKRQCLSNKNQIVSRETIWNRDRAVEIVSRETILQVADKRRTVLAQAKADEAISTGARQGEAIRDRDCNPEIVSRETISGSTVDSRLLLLQMGLTSILAGFLFIGLFDHYFWTLQQGQLVFWIVLGAIASIKR